MTTLPAHSKVGASSMERWANCPGSVRECRDIPDKTSEFAAEGSAAHEFAEQALTESQIVQPGAKWEHDGFEGVVTQEMSDAVELYFREVAKRRFPGTQMQVEHKFHLQDLHPAMFGTSDCVLYTPHGKRLDVIDFKYGAGIAVEAKDNKQGMYYAVGAMLELGLPVDTVNIVIVQPRAEHRDGPVREWTVDPMTLLDFAADMVEAVKATEDPNAPLNPGPWCRKYFCSALTRCPAVQQQALATAKTEFEPATMSQDDLALWLDRLPVLEGFIKAVRERAHQEAADGNPPPGYALVEKRATEKWGPMASAAELAKASGRMEEDFLKAPDLITPAQARKLFPGKNDKERRAAMDSCEMTVKESSGFNLVKITNNDGQLATQGSEFLPAE